MKEGNLAKKIEFDDEEVGEKKEPAKVYDLQDMIPHPATPEEIKNEVERIARIREEYMDEKNPNSVINIIKNAIERGDRKSAEEIRDNKLDELNTELIFIADNVDPAIDKEKNRLQGVVEYYSNHLM